VGRGKSQVQSRTQPCAAFASELQGSLCPAQIDWIAEDIGSAIVEATLPKGMWEAVQPTAQETELQMAMRRHLIRLTQDWAEQVAAEVLLITEA